MTWASQYIGEPWISGENDCWSFARKVWKEQFNLDVPVVDIDACNRLACCRAFAGHGERGNWLMVAAPEEGDAVLMGTNKRPSHVGVSVNGGVLHCMQNAGVVFSSDASLAAVGLRILAYYRRIQ